MHAARAALAGGRPQGRHPAGHPRRRPARGRRLAPRPDPARGRRPLRRRPLGRPLRAATSAPPAAWPCPSRCTRPAGRRSPALDELAGAGVPTLVVQGERDPMGRPEEFPADGTDLDRRARRRPRVQGAEARARSARTTRWRSWSRRRWSGWSARSPAARPASGISAPTGRVETDVLARPASERPTRVLDDADAAVVWETMTESLQTRATIPTTVDLATETEAERAAALRARRAAVPRPALLAPRCG